MFQNSNIEFCLKYIYNKYVPTFGLNVKMKFNEYCPNWGK